MSCNCGCNGADPNYIPCPECEALSDLEQLVLDAVANEKTELEHLRDDAKESADAAAESADEAAQSASEAKHFRDDAQTAANSATGSLKTIMDNVLILEESGKLIQQAADDVLTAIASIAVRTWYYTITTDGQTQIPVPVNMNVLAVQNIYIEGVRQDLNRGFTFDKTTMTITLARGLPKGMEITVVLGAYNTDSAESFPVTLASNNGAALVGTSSGNTVQEELNEFGNPDKGDSKISVKQPFTNAQQRTQHDKNQEIVSVLDFVAKTDVLAIISGTLDATSAFNAAASAYPGGPYVPSGTYLIPSDIPGKFWGPGKRIKITGGDPIPFTNPAQTHGTLFLGFDAGKAYAGNDITGQVVCVGPGAGRNVTVGYNIVGLGAGVLTGDTLVDALTDTSPCTGNELIGIGINALKKAITLNNSIGIGRDALNETKFGSFNIGIGSSSFQQLHTGSNNVGVGRSTGMRAGIVTDSSGKRLSFSIVNGCTFIGNAAGREITSGDNNTYVGNNSGRGVTSTTNTFTGTATGSNNVALGADALNAVGTASNNVMLGRGAGRTLSSGNGNIFIGDLAGAGISSGDNQFVVANQGSLPFLQGLMAGPQNPLSYLRVDGVLTPAADNTRAIGSGGYRWSQVFAAAGAINTSDGTVKTDVSAPTDTEIRVAKKLKSLIVRYKFIDAVEEKGKEARWHFGVIAQEVEKAFAEEGLNASDYGLFCYDEWEDQYQTIPAEMVYHPAVTSSLVSPDGEQLIIEEERWEVIKPAKQVLVKEAGGRYGIRYEELLCFIIAAL